MCLSDRLDDIAEQVQSVTIQWQSRLTNDDYIALVSAFHRAESLAHAALVQAIDQVSDEYRPLLLEQLDDETRHVNVFADWHAEPPGPVKSPLAKNRPQHVWFALLLANEVAGFCQFHMLHALVPDADKAAEVLGIVEDEKRHISRLATWLKAYENKPAHVEINKIYDAFCARLEFRMRQFLPREELEQLRIEISAMVTELMATFYTGNTAFRTNPVVR